MPELHDTDALALGAAIGAGRLDPVDLARHFLDRIERLDPDRTVYVRTTPERALAEAEDARGRAKAGLRRGPLDGVPVSWKDLYDTAGIPTEGGSPLLAGRVPARDAAAVARARDAGMVCLGKTMTVEFALGGVGTNPHLGTPANAALGDVPRAPGGSSAGAAVSVARGLAPLAVGSDTGGSVRIPAAWNRLVGLKTGIGQVPREGVLPLSPTLDTVGPLCRSVADAAAMFAVLAADPPVDLAGADARGLRLLVARDVVWEETDGEVEAAVRDAIGRLEKAGAAVGETDVPEFAEMHAVLQERGGIVTAEGWATWKGVIGGHEDEVDPDVMARMDEGRRMSAPDLLEVRATARRLARSLDRRLAGCDALLLPTVPVLPPPLAGIAGDRDAYARANGLALRNTRLGNVLAHAAVTLPCPGDVPAGLMLARPAGEDRAVLRVAAACEAALA